MRRLGRLFRRWADYIVGGVIGAALVTFLFNWAEGRHKAAVTLVNDQISKLYQPFYAASVENDMAWCVFVEGTWRATTTDRPLIDLATATPRTAASLMMEEATRYCISASTR